MSFNFQMGFKTFKHYQNSLSVWNQDIFLKTIILIAFYEMFLYQINFDFKRNIILRFIWLALVINRKFMHDSYALIWLFNHSLERLRVSKNIIFKVSFLLVFSETHLLFNNGIHEQTLKVWYAREHVKKQYWIAP